MPLYQYACKECKHEEEALRKVAQYRDPGPDCPNGHGPMGRSFTYAAKTRVKIDFEHHEIRAIVQESNKIEAELKREKDQTKAKKQWDNRKIIVGG